MWSDKAFRIYLGDAGEGIDPARRDVSTDGVSFARTSRAGDGSGEAPDARSGGWLIRTVTALADRAALTRTARS